jgi:hypothetical protein
MVLRAALRGLAGTGLALPPLLVAGLTPRPAISFFLTGDALRRRCIERGIAQRSAWLLTSMARIAE